MDINKLKVADLRKELQSRGLDSKGNKPVLVERLREAIEKENAEEEESENEESSSVEENSIAYETAESANTTTQDMPTASEEKAFSVITATENNVEETESEYLGENNATFEKSPESSPEPEKEEPIPSIEEETSLQEMETIEEPVENSPEPDVEPEPELEPEPEPEPELESEPEPELEPEPEPEPIIEKVEESTIETQTNGHDDYQTLNEPEKIEEIEPIEKVDAEPATEIENIESIANEEPVVEEIEENGQQAKIQDQSVADEFHPSFEENEKSSPFPEQDEKMETDAIEDKPAEETPADEECLWNSDEESSVQVPAPEPEQEPELSADEPKKRVRRSRFDQPDERKRKHSPSPSGDGFQSGYYDAPSKIPKQDDEPSFDDNSVILSWYDSDLNLTINKENFVSAVPLYDQGFMYMWSGVRSTYGFKSGKVYYDVKLMEKCPVNVYDDFEIYSFRLGWSVAYSSLQLGETSLSFGYDSSGKKCTNDTFEEYGQPFNAEDVIGCLVDFESHEENVHISFTFNGVKQDIAFEVPKASLEDKALFPHILSKNIGFEVNFGDRAEPWNTDENFKDEFEWASKVQSELRVTGPRKAENKSDCEVIMVCGLPCSGKTTWVKNHVDSHPEKMYNIIGIDAALNRMKVLNEPIQNYYKDAPDMLVEKCTKCINRLIDLGSIRWRNYILDQTNVLPQVQRRKMRNFDGYNRIAIVIIPSEEEYERYLEKWNDNTLRDSSVSLLELKGNFKLPEEGELFNSVSFVGVEKDQAEEIVRKYNKEGRDARPRDERPYNRGYGGRDHMDRMPSYGRPPMGGFRSRWMDRGPPPGMGRGGWGPRGGMDRMPPGFRDRRNWRDRSPDDDRDGNFRGRYQQRGMPGGRYGNGGPMMGNNRNWGAGRDRDRMGPRIGGPPGPNPLLAPMMGKPMMGYGPGERKGRFGSDDGKRRDDGDSDEFDRTGRVNPPGVDEDVEEPFDEGSGGEDGERKRRSRFSDTDRKDGPGGYRGRGGFQRGGNGGRGRGNGRPAPFPPGKPPRGGGGYNRGRGPDSGADYYGGRGGGQPRRDSRDRNQMGQRQGSSRFDKRDSGGKSDMNSQMSNPPPGWAMYGQGGWNQAAASHYQNWAQYQQGYNAQQMQQYWSQVQQQAQQGQQNQQSQHSGLQITKSGSNNSATNASSSTPTTSQTTSNSSQQQLSTSSAGYNTQGYNTAGYSGQGYDANAYAQYCAQYYQLAQQQGWTQNAWAAYNYNYGAMAASAGNVGGLPSTSVPPPSVTGGAGGASGGNSSGNQSSAVTSGSNK